VIENKPECSRFTSQPQGNLKLQMKASDKDIAKCLFIASAKSHSAASFFVMRNLKYSIENDLD